MGKKRPSPAPADGIAASDDDDRASTISEASEREEGRVAESRLRLAKQYLERLEKETRAAGDGSEAPIDRETMAARLRQDVLVGQGRQFELVAEHVRVEGAAAQRFARLGYVPTCIASHGDLVVVGDKHGLVYQYRAGQRTHVYRKGAGNGVPCVATDGTHVAVGHANGRVDLFRADNHALVCSFGQHRAAVNGLALAAGQLFSCSDDRTLRQWSVEPAAFVDVLYGHQEGVLAIDAVASREECVTVGGRDRTARLWRVAEETQLVFRASGEAEGSLEAVRIIDEDHFVTGSDGGTLALWDRRRKRPIHAIVSAHAGPIVSVASKRSSDLVVTGSMDGSVRLWRVAADLRSLSLVGSLPVEGFVNGLTVAADDTLLVAVGREHRSGRWQVFANVKNAVLAFGLSAGRR